MDPVILRVCSSGVAEDEVGSVLPAVGLAVPSMSHNGPCHLGQELLPAESVQRGVLCTCRTSPFTLWLWKVVIAGERRAPEAI